MIQTSYSAGFPVRFEQRTSAAAGQTPGSTPDGYFPAPEDPGLIRPNAAHRGRGTGHALRTSARVLTLLVALTIGAGVSGCATMTAQGPREDPGLSYQLGKGTREISNGFRDFGVGIYDNLLKPFGHAVRDQAQDFGRGVSGKPPAQGAQQPGGKR